MHLGQERIHCRGFIFLLRKVYLSSNAELFPFLQREISVILQFRSNLLRDFLNKVCSSLLVFRIFVGFPFELDWPMGLHHMAPFAVIPVDGWFRTEPHQTFFPPACLVPLDFSFRESSLRHAFTLMSSRGFSFTSDRNLGHTAKFTISLSIQYGFFNI